MDTTSVAHVLCRIEDDGSVTPVSEHEDIVAAVIAGKHQVEVDGAKLRQLRRRRMLSLRELGQRSGVAFDNINKLENERRRAQPRTLRKLAEALGVEPHELMKGE